MKALAATGSSGCVAWSRLTAVRLGRGHGIALSFDGKWALARLLGDPSKLLRLPTGAGETRQIATPGFHVLERRLVARWEAHRVHCEDRRRMRPRICRIWTAAILAASPQQSHSCRGRRRHSGCRPTANGSQGRSSTDRPCCVPVDGGEPQYLPMLTADDRPLNWSADGKAIFLERAVPDKRWATSIVRYDLATSQITPVRQIEPSDLAGIAGTGPGA